jgi:hypothetical protein
MKIKFTASLLPLSPLIRLWTWSAVSHCEFEFSDGIQIVPAMEAGRVIATRNRKYRWEYNYSLDITAEQEQIVRSWSEAELGKPYDYTALAPLNILIPRTKKNWRDDRQWMCSEFCARGLELVGIELFPDTWKKITPGDLLSAVKTCSKATLETD